MPGASASTHRSPRYLVAMEFKMEERCQKAFGKVLEHLFYRS